MSFGVSPRRIFIFALLGGLSSHSPISPQSPPIFPPCWCVVLVFALFCGLSHGGSGGCCTKRVTESNVMAVLSSCVLLRYSCLCAFVEGTVDFFETVVNDISDLYGWNRMCCTASEFCDLKIRAVAYGGVGVSKRVFGVACGVCIGFGDGRGGRFSDHFVRSSSALSASN